MTNPRTGESNRPGKRVILIAAAIGGAVKALIAWLLNHFLG
ncbi:hypothetical protein [Streptomyces sp. Isolate_45]|nr:hypothetical protein [Streptomyces sp. Isolate_45]MDA5283694.1 hypothetical protein [Streptomyces sp. Isolate_45]